MDMLKADLQMGKAYFQRLLLGYLFGTKVNRHMQCFINKVWFQMEFEYQLFEIRNQWINSSSVAISNTESNLSYLNK